MKLSDWLKGKGRTQDKLAIAVGVTQGRISQIANRGTSDLRMAMLIEDATDYEVTLKDLLMEKKSEGDEAAA